jgi:hypothetical protein
MLLRSLFLDKFRTITFLFLTIIATACSSSHLEDLSEVKDDPKAGARLENKR